MSSRLTSPLRFSVTPRCPIAMTSLNPGASRSMSRNSSYENMPNRFVGDTSDRSTRRLGSASGSGRKKSASRSPNMDAVTPIPAARVRMASTAYRGWRSRIRNEWATSFMRPPWMLDGSRVRRVGRFSLPEIRQNGLLQCFDRECDAVATAQAQRRDAALLAAAAQRVDQRGEHVRAARPNRMADRDGAAVHVHLCGFDPEFALQGYDLHRERFVDLEEVHVLQVPADLLRDLADRFDRRHEHELRRQT